jgi:hypothetical protein
MTGRNLLERYGALSENPAVHISAGTSVPRVVRGDGQRKLLARANEPAVNR